MRTPPFLLSIVSLLHVTTVLADVAPRTLSLTDVLHQVESTRPDLKASKLGQAQANYAVTRARSVLLPQLDLSVVDSWGMAGASAPVPLQFGGVMASPFRVGVGGGLVGKFTLLDISGIRAVKEAQEYVRTASEQTRLDRANINQTALQLYFQTSELRSEWEVWQEQVEAFQPILSHVTKFVRIGQYSDVQRFLIVHQIENAKAQRDVAEGRYRANLERLKVFIGLGESRVDYPSITKIDERALEVIEPGNSSPLVTRAEAQVRAAEARASMFAAEHLPKIYSLGSVGFLENSQLVSTQNYSAWVGVTVPVFQGFRISSEIHQARAQAEQQQELLSATRLALDDLNISYQESILTAKTQLKYLIQEKEVSQNAFKLARQRYFAFVEPLANLIQAMNDLNQVKLQLSQVQEQLLTAQGAMLLVNGGTVK